MAKTNAVFKNALGGYNKSEVNAYIAAAGAEMKEKEEKFKLGLERAERDLAAEKEAHAVTEGQLDELGFELYEATTALDAEKKAHKTTFDQLDELGFELYRVKSELDAATLRETELKNTLMGLSARIAELEGELKEKNDELNKLGELVGVENDDDPEVAQKAALYDKLSDRIGEIMLNADSNAERILNSAIERGDELLANAQNEANEIIKAAEEEAKKLRDHCKDTANEYYDEVAVFVSEIKDGLENFIREIGTKRTELEGKIEYMSLPSSSQQKPDIAADCTDKSVVTPSAEHSPESKNYSAIDEKIESFFKRTMAAINAFRKKK